MTVYAHIAKFRLNLNKYELCSCHVELSDKISIHSRIGPERSPAIFFENIKPTLKTITRYGFSLFVYYTRQFQLRLVHFRPKYVRTSINFV